MLAWWAGPALVSLALDEDQRSTPYYVIHLLNAENTSGYFEAFGSLLREEEAQLLWRGSLQALHSGRTRDEMNDVALLEFNAGSRVVRMLTSSAYRDLTAVNEPVLLGTALPPGPIAQDETLLLWLVELVEGGDVSELESLGDSAATAGGQRIWSAPISVLSGDRGWNHALLIAFPDSAALNRWMEAPATATARALARRQYVVEAMLELQSG